MCKRCWCWSRILQTLPVPSPCGARLICLPPSAVLTMLSTVRHVDPPPPQHRSLLLPLLQVSGSRLFNKYIYMNFIQGFRIHRSFFMKHWMITLIPISREWFLWQVCVSTSEICNDHESWKNTCISVLIHVYVEILLILSSNNSFSISMYFVEFCQ